MNVLILSLDQSLITGTGIGDSLERFRSYARHLTSLLVLIPTTSSSATGLNQTKIAIIPIKARSKIFAYLNLIQQLRRLSVVPDLIVTNDPILGLIALISRGFSSNPKIQINVFGLPLFNSFWYHSRPLNFFFAPFYVIALKLADGVRTDNKSDRQQLIKKLKLNPDTTVVIPVPPSQKIQSQIKTTAFNQNIKHSLAGNHNLVLSVGSLTSRKGFDTLLISAKKVLAIHPKTTFLLVGSGQELPTLKKSASKLGITNHVIFKPAATYQQLLGYYQIADIFVLASRLEGLPRVFMEAALSKTPIVATDTAGIRDLIVNHRSGKIVPTDNPESLAQAISQLLSDPDQAKAFADLAYKQASLYLDFKKNTNLLINSWQSLIDHGNHH